MLSGPASELSDCAQWATVESWGGGDPTSGLTGLGAPPPLLQTPEEERGLLHSDSNGYTNLPDVVQPSHSPTEAKSSNGSSSPTKDVAADVSQQEAQEAAEGPRGTAEERDPFRAAPGPWCWVVTRDMPAN